MKIKINRNPDSIHCLGICWDQQNFAIGLIWIEILFTKKVKNDR